jgi:hypothetical protein
MSEFTYLFRGRNIPASPEERQKHLDKWAGWDHMNHPGAAWRTAARL